MLHSLRFSRRPVLAAVAVVVCLVAVGVAGSAGAAKTQILEIASKAGVYAFEIELATTEKQRERGLMFRKSLPPRHGMLFDFEHDRVVAMWMKNTYIPLDMIFIAHDGRITRIAQNTTPMSTAIIYSGGPVRAVLEVAGGTTRRLGIVPGDVVSYPIFTHGP